MGGDIRDAMSQEEKMKQFDASMRKKFGAAWDFPPLPQEEAAAAPRVEGYHKNPLPILDKEWGHVKATVETAQAAAPAQPEAKRTLPNRAENVLMLHLMILRNALCKYGAESKQRLKQASPTAWRDLNLIVRLTEKIQTAMLSTMPESRQDYYEQYRRHAVYKLDIKGPLMSNTHVVATEKYMAAVMEAAMEEACVMCMRTGNEVESCLIRKCFLEQMPPQTIRKFGCEYREMAGKLLREEDVTI